MHAAAKLAAVLAALAAQPLYAQGGADLLGRDVHPDVGLSTPAAPVAVVSSYGTMGSVAVSGGVRAYFSGHAPDGFWLGGQAIALLQTGSGVDLLPQAGYQWVLDNGCTIEVGAGLSLASLAAGQGGFAFM